jgi:uncharacterized protein
MDNANELRRVRLATGRLEAYVRDLLTRPEIARLPYHNLEHSLDVAVTAASLAQEEGFAKREQLYCTAAGYLHDIGYLVRPEHNEPVGARISARILPNFGYLPTEAAYISHLILGTDYTKPPVSHGQKVLRDADHRNLGSEDFLERNEAYRREVGKPADAGWYSFSLGLLQNYRYFTVAARRRYGTRKTQNARMLAAFMEREGMSPWHGR